jgi:hypothetical protein
MKKTVPLLEKGKLKSLYLDIIKGYSLYREEGALISFYIKHLDMGSSSEIDSIYQECYEKAKKEGLPTEEEQLKYLNKEELWTKEEESNLQNKESLVQGLKLSKSKVYLQAQIDYFREEIQKEEEELEKMRVEKAQFIGFTAESYANKKVNEFYIYITVYKDEELKNRFFSEEEFEYIDFEKFAKLVQSYNQSTKYFNAKNLKRVALSTFFLNYFYLCDDNPQIFFGKPVIDLTYHQVELFGYARHFKHLLSDMKATPPSEYYDDPDKLIEFVEAGKNAEKMLEKADQNSKEHGAMSVVGATKEDLERMGLTPGSSEELSGTSLSKEAAKKKGSLDMEDIIKIHEKGHL